MRPLQSDVVRFPMKGLILAGICLGALIVAAAVALRIYRGDREYRIFLGSLAGSVLLYAALLAASRAGRAGLRMDEVLRQFETSDRANQLLRRRLPKLVRGGYLREERGK